MKEVRAEREACPRVFAALRRAGGLPQVMGFSEVYQALQTGVVGGTENL